jgi:hypothetical protein
MKLTIDNDYNCHIHNMKIYYSSIRNANRDIRKGFSLLVLASIWLFIVSFPVLRQAQYDRKRMPFQSSLITKVFTPIRGCDLPSTYSYNRSTGYCLAFKG